MYYIIHEGNVMIADTEQALVDYNCEIKVLPTDYEYGKYIVVDDELVLNPNWEEEQAAKERIRLNNLQLTKADFWIALIEKGITKQMVKDMVIEAIPDEMLKAKTLIRIDDADHFWRGDASMNIIGAQFGITPDMLDYLFENKQLPDDYIYILPEQNTDLDNNEGEQNDNT